MPERQRLVLEPNATDPEVGRWLAALEDGRGDTLRELDGVTPEMVDQRPDGPLDTIGTILYHVGLIEADWVAADILGLTDPADLGAWLPWPDRTPDARLTVVTGVSLEDHVARLAGIRSWVLDRLDPMTADDFHRVRAMPDYDVAPDWAIHHILQHEAEHRAHIAWIRDTAPSGMTMPPRTRLLPAENRIPGGRQAVETSVDRDTGMSSERLHWSIEAGGRTNSIDLFPAVFGRFVAVVIDGRRVGRIRKPTEQHPWHEATFPIGGVPTQVALTWHFPVMRTDVFLEGRSVRDGQMIGAARADAPAALSNFEVCSRPIFSGPFPSLRASNAIVVVCLAVWLLCVAVVSSTPPVGQIAAAGFAIASLPLILAIFWSSSAFSDRVRVALLDRPGLGDWRIVLWLGAWFGHLILIMVVVFGALVVIASL